MLKLIGIELFKIVKKKSFMIILIISVIFSLFCNIVYKTLPDVYEEDIDASISELEKLKSSDKDSTISIKSELNVYYDAKKYDKDSWQYNYILNEDSYRELMTDVVACDINNDLSEECKLYKEKYETYQKLFKENDWRKVAEYQLEDEKAKFAIISEGLDKDSDEYVYNKMGIEKIEYRLKTNISYADKEKSQILNRYFENKGTLLSYKDEDINKMKKNERAEYIELKSEYKKGEYMLNHKYNDSFDTLSTILQNFYLEFGIIILVMILMISGTIMSQEYNKGTIKLLLVKPYSRSKLLLSKYITVLLMILISYVIIFGIELIVGGLFFGFDTLTQPVLVYNPISDSLITMNIFKYNMMTFIGNLPFFIFVATVSFAISTIFANTAVSIISGFAINIVTNILALISDSAKWTKYLIFTQMDISNFALCGTTKYFDDNLFFKLFICIIYILLVIIPTFIIFKKKDIKNV